MDDKEMAQLDLIIQGRIKDKSLVEQRNYRYALLLWEFWKHDRDLFLPDIKKNVSNPSLEDKPHCIVFVFDGSMDDIPNGDEETKFYKDIIQMARERKYFYPQVVLTCKDKLLQQILDDNEEDESDYRISSLNTS